MKIVGNKIYYHDEVRKLEEGSMSFEEFCKVVFGKFPLDYTETLAVFTIYEEDGGKKFTVEDFIINCCVPSEKQIEAAELDSKKRGIYWDREKKKWVRKNETEEEDIIKLQVNRVTDPKTKETYWVVTYQGESRILYKNKDLNKIIKWVEENLEKL